MNRSLTATILIILSIGIYITFTRGMYEQAKAVKVINDQYTAAIKGADELIKARDKVINDDKNISDKDRDQLNKILPSTVDNIRLVIDLNGIARRHGFSLKNIKAVAAPVVNVQGAPAAQGIQANNNNTIPTPTLDVVNVSFGVTAPYLEFIRFLQDIESNLRIMDITHLTVTATDTGTYDFNVELKTYWMRQH